MHKLRLDLLVDFELFQSLSIEYLVLEEVNVRVLQIGWLGAAALISNILHFVCFALKCDIV